MKRFISSILVFFFVLLSPLSAWASTTESMMMYSVMPLSNDGIATASVADFDISFSVGEYNINTDTYTFGSATSKVSTDGKISSYADARYTFNYDTNKCIALKVKLSDFSSLSDLRFVLGRFSLSLFNSSSLVNSNRYFMNLSKARPFGAYADITWGGTLNYGSTHITSSATSKAAISPNAISNFPNGDNYSLLLDLSGSFDVPDKTLWKNYYEHPDGTNLYGVYIKDITLVFTYFINDAFYNVSTGNLFLDNISAGDTSVLYLYCDTNYCVLSGSSYGDSSGISSLGVSLNNSIQNLSNNVSTQINQVKTAISNSTNTITTKIQTMETNVVDGLNNVVAKAKENTDKIIATVTDKVDEVKEGITEVKDSIIDLPNKIEEMLMGLIVPDPETMSDKFSDFSGLLEEKLGVIYQIPTMLFDFFDTIVNAATTPQTSLTLPAFDLPWIDGSTLRVWNPVEFKIIPDGMQVLSDLIQTITSMTVVVLTFNSVKRAYERFLRS